MKLPAKIFLFGGLSAVFIALQWSGPTFTAESLKGSRVLVTGASTGIGEQMAYHYARLGAQIVITARRENVLKEVVKKCLDLGAQKALYIAADMAIPADADKVVEFAEKQLEGLDYIVLNHIGSSSYGMWDEDVDHNRWLMQVNFHSYVQMAVKALPALEKTNGSIVVVSSMLGKMCAPFALPYTATKFALNGFFGSLEHELVMKKSNVSITICTLGFIDTESAMEKVKGYIEMTPYPAHEAAWEIIKAGALRQSETFYPWYTYYATLIRDWFPYYRDQMIRKAYIYNPLATKVGIAGGAVYVAYDSGLLGGSAEGSEALNKAKAAVPPAVEEWSKYFGFELPAAPKIEFSSVDAWNSGVQKSIRALSVAPSALCEYTSQGFQYVKELIK